MADKPNLALFDFDGTITTKDTLVEFIRFAVGRAKFYQGLLVLSPMLIAFKLKFISNAAAKERLLAHFFMNWDADVFQQLADRYALGEIDKIVSSKAMAAIGRHRRQGDTVVVVSASIESWLRAWCRANNIDLIATRLEVDAGRLTGRFATKNCYGSEKVHRIKARYNLSDFKSVYAYGDSRGDREMLEIADKRYYRRFD